MKSNHDDSPTLYAAKVVRKRAKPLLDEAEGVRKGKDVECVHRMRVATRRLSSALGLFEDCFPRKHVQFWQKRLRRLRRALGKSRDLDVQIAFLVEFLRESDEFLGGMAEAEYRPGIRRLLAGLRRRRARRQRKVAKALRRFEAHGVLEDLKQTLKAVRSAGRAQGGVGLRERARVAILARLNDLLALEPCVSRPEDAESHHAMRIAAKRLRYTLEVFRPLYGGPIEKFIATARDTQRRLGEIHDCDVWVDFLTEFLAREEQRSGAAARAGLVRPGILFLRRDRSRQRQRVFKDFAAAWERLRKGRFWERLDPVVRTEPVSARPAAAPSVLAGRLTEALRSGADFSYPRASRCGRLPAARLGKRPWPRIPARRGCIWAWTSAARRSYCAWPRSRVAWWPATARPRRAAASPAPS